MKVLLVISGVLIFLASLGCLGLGGVYSFVLPGVAEDPATSGEMPVALGVSMGLFFLTMAIGIGWLAIGSILCRKWARDILYAGGWLIAVVVAAGAIGMLFFIPNYLEAFNALNSGMSGSPGIPMGAMMVIGMLIGFGIYLLPAVYLILIYGLRNVRLTVKYRDAKPRWTDRMPVPLLALWLAFVWAALAFASLAPFYGEAIVIAGAAQSEVLVTFVLVLIGAFLGVLAWVTTRLTPTAWWILLGGIVLIGAGWVGGTLMIDMSELMDSMNTEMGDPSVTTMQVDMNEALYGDQSAFVIPSVIFQIALIGFVVWLRRYFFTPSSSSEA